MAQQKFNEQQITKTKKLKKQRQYFKKLGKHFMELLGIEITK